MSEEKCPFDFNFNPDSFKVGDTVSYRVAKLGDWPFAATIAAVHADYIEIIDPSQPEKVMRATRVSRPVVADEEALS